LNKRKRNEEKRGQSERGRSEVREEDEEKNDGVHDNVSSLINLSTIIDRALIPN
jgi:hypothetical protein